MPHTYCFPIFWEAFQDEYITIPRWIYHDSKMNISCLDSKMNISRFQDAWYIHLGKVSKMNISCQDHDINISQLGTIPFQDGYIIPKSTYHMVVGFLESVTERFWERRLVCIVLAYMKAMLFQAWACISRGPNREFSVSPHNLTVSSHKPPAFVMTLMRYIIATLKARGPDIFFSFFSLKER